MKPTVKVTVKSDKSTISKKLLAQLSKAKALVGWTEEAGSRPGEMVTNTELAFIHTYGSPIRNIPARPILEPALSTAETKDAVCVELKDAAKAMLSGDRDKMVEYLYRAGQEGENASRAWFEDSRNGWAPNAPSTIARKGSDRPLIDTARLRKSLTHTVSEE